jgi:hypothetical protein
MMNKALVEFTDMVNKNLYLFIDVKQGARLKRRLVHRAIINHQYQGNKKGCEYKSEYIYNLLCSILGMSSIINHQCFK